MLPIDGLFGSIESLPVRLLFGIPDRVPKGSTFDVRLGFACPAVFRMGRVISHQNSLIHPHVSLLTLKFSLFRKRVQRAEIV